jgi:hypothetical protein
MAPEAEPNYRDRNLWEVAVDSNGGRYTWAIPSPDGNYLAIRAPSTERNAWLIENF